MGHLGVVPATGQPNEGQRPIDLLVIGDVNPDLIVRGAGLTPSFGQVETLVEGTALTVGGSGSITACGAARLGLSIAIAGLIGVDLFGEFMRRALDERGVDTRGLIADPTLSTGLTVILDRGEDRAILTHPGTIAQMTTDRVKPELLALARHIHISSYYLQTALWTGLPKLLRTARRQGTTISIDPNWDPSERWDSGLPQLLPNVDLLLPNAAEARGLSGLDGPEAAAVALAGLGPLTVVKLGDEGAVAAEPDGTVTYAPARPAEVVDMIGAGDAFDAGLLYGWLGGAELPDALALACACGALSTRSGGAVPGQATLAEARAHMK